VIHVYAIARELEELPPVGGLGDAPLERRRVGGLDVVVSRTEADEPSEEAIIRHAEVVEALASRSNALLPARFGDVFSNERELAGAIERKRAELESALARVRGCVEFGLRVLLPDSDSARPRAARTGREYMALRLDEANRRTRLAEQVDEPLAELARASMRSAESSELLLAASYLVPERDAQEFRTRVELLQSRHPDLSIVCSGPWPPYSFAGETGSEE
jgi:hypothetical protein